MKQLALILAVTLLLPACDQAAHPWSLAEQNFKASSRAWALVVKRWFVRKGHSHTVILITYSSDLLTATQARESHAHQHTTPTMPTCPKLFKPIICAAACGYFGTERDKMIFIRPISRVAACPGLGPQGKCKTNFRS